MSEPAPIAHLPSLDAAFVEVGPKPQLRCNCCACEYLRGIFAVALAMLALNLAGWGVVAVALTKPPCDVLEGCP